LDYISLGKTNLLVSKTAFGAESLDCKEIEAFGAEADRKAWALVHQAYSGGMNFFDTSHSKPVCEKRLGSALRGIRHNVFIATKSSAQNSRELRLDIQESLDCLQSKTVDLFQLENPLFIPRPNEQDGLYNELLAQKEKGIIRHFGIATENLDMAREVIQSDLYEVVQFPFSMISPDEVYEIVHLCEENDVGCIAMQPLNGGIVNDIPLALGFFMQEKCENVVPVWGIHTQEELQQILYFNDHQPVIDKKFVDELEMQKMFFN
jgi:aryl-alcohol dehydrogenase-like predicted oxidoreductase